MHPEIQIVTKWLWDSLWSNYGVNRLLQKGWGFKLIISHCFQCMIYKVQSLTRVFSLFSCLINQLPSALPCLLCRGLSSGFSRRHRYDRNACGRQSGDARKRERGKDESGGEICSPSLLGGPVPECECQLLHFNFPCWSAASMKSFSFNFSPREAVVTEDQVCDCFNESKLWQEVGLQ